jgi:hypothetical protein
MRGPVLAALLWALAPAAGAQTISRLDLSPPEARSLAVQAVLAGDAILAHQLASALVVRDPEDAAALRVLAAVEPVLGRPAAGRAAAAEAWRLSGSPERRYEAARLAARAALAEDRPGLARWWLRLALLSAPTSDETARTRQDAARLGDMMPWRWDASLSFGPSRNVNGGSETPFNVIEGLPFVGVISVDGRALSGWTGILELSARRRLAESETTRWEAGLKVWARGVTLSDEARALIAAERDPEDGPLTGADFSSSLVEASLRHDRLAGRWLLGAEAAAGLAWHGGELSYGLMRGAAKAARPLGERQGLSFDAFTERRWSEDGDRQADRVGASVEWSVRLERAGRLAFSLGRGATLSDNRNTASDYWAVQARWTLAEPVGPARLDLRVGAQRTDYPDYAVFFPVPGGRQDERRWASVEATFADWDVAGFAPVVSVEASRTDSNVSRFDAEGVTVGFGFRSTF